MIGGPAHGPVEKAARHKPDGPCFDRGWRARSRVRLSSVAECDRFFRAHYLRRRPGVVPLVLSVDVDLQPMGMICFGLPPRETGKRYKAECWELARVWLDDSLPTNAETWAIGQAVRYVKRHHPEVGCLVSYADPTVGHEGRMYLAANWTPDGRTDEDRLTPRFDLVERSYDLLGPTVKRYSRAAHAPVATLERLPRASKRRYIYRLRTA